MLSKNLWPFLKTTSGLSESREMPNQIPKQLQRYIKKLSGSVDGIYIIFKVGDIGSTEVKIKCLYFVFMCIDDDVNDTLC